MNIKNLFRPPFIVKQMGEYAKSKTEHGNTIVLFRTTIKHHAPSRAGIITFGTGVNIDIKKGYIGIIQPRTDIYKSGLTMANSPSIIRPGDNKEVTLDFYLSQNGYYTEHLNYYEPYELGNVIGYVTIVKSNG